MGVYWNPSNTCYYRSLERSAMNVYLATQGTSGTPRVKTPTGINYTLNTPGCPTSGGTKTKPTQPKKVAGPECDAKQALMQRMKAQGFAQLEYGGETKTKDGQTRHYIRGRNASGGCQSRYYVAS